MSGRVIRFERITSRSGVVEEPVITAKGNQLADPAHANTNIMMRACFASVHHSRPVVRHWIRVWVIR
jgi:hypothetical protein